MLHLIGVNGNMCDDRTINSTKDFVQVMKEVEDNSMQRNCYVLKFGQNNFDFNFTETVSISTNITLHGIKTVITCSYPANLFNHSAIIMVKNVHYFGIRGITFLGCPSSLHFENVTRISINDSHFR